MTPTRLDFLRHGEPEGGRMFRGHGVDHPLSETGWRQMREAAAPGAPWTHIVSSPLVRCRAFAEVLAGERDLAVSIDERLREIGFGIWEGRAPDALAREQPEAYAAYRADPAHARPEGAESARDFAKRVGDALDDMLREYRAARVLVVAHAGVMRAAFAHALGADLGEAFRTRVPYAGWLHIEARGDGMSAFWSQAQSA